MGKWENDQGLFSFSFSVVLNLVQIFEPGSEISEISIQHDPPCQHPVDGIFSLSQVPFWIKRWELWENNKWLLQAAVETLRRRGRKRKHREHWLLPNALPPESNVHLRRRTEIGTDEISLRTASYCLNPDSLYQMDETHLACHAWFLKRDSPVWFATLHTPWPLKVQFCHKVHHSDG